MPDGIPQSEMERKVDEIRLALTGDLTGGGLVHSVGEIRKSVDANGQRLFTLETKTKLLSKQLQKVEIEGRIKQGVSRGMATGLGVGGVGAGAGLTEFIKRFFM